MKGWTLWRKTSNELKDIVMKRTNQSFKMDPKLLEQWNSTMLVIRRSPWTNMRLILNKVTSDNIANLFPSDWAPKPCFSEIKKKTFQNSVRSDDCNVLPVWNSSGL